MILVSQRYGDITFRKLVQIILGFVYKSCHIYSTYSSIPHVYKSDSVKARILVVLFAFSCLSAAAQVEKIRALQRQLPVLTDSTRYVDALNKISLLFYEQNVDSTLFYALKAREISSHLHYVQGLADATNNLGVVFDIKGNSQLALRYYNDAYNQYTARKDSSNIVQTLMNIAMVYYGSGKDQKALANLDRALVIGEKIKRDSITALLIYNYILAYPQKFSASRKAHYIQKASQIADKYRDVRLKLAIQQLIADDLIATNRYKEGVRLLESTLESSKKMQLNYLSMDLLIDLGEHYRDSADIGINYFKTALQTAEQKNYRMYAKDVCKRLYDLYLKKDSRDTAFAYSQKLLTLYEQQIEIDKRSGIDYIEYAVKDQQLASEQLSSGYKSQMLWLAIAVCVLTLLSIIFLFRNWRLGSKTNNILRMQFEQLESTSEALETTNQHYAQIIKIVAHDLRNPIGAVSSLSTMLLQETLTSDERAQFIGLIHESSTSCLHLIEELLKTDFTIDESELTIQEINLSLFLKQAVTLLNFRALEKNQQLILEEAGPITVRADRDKLLRVVNNLIINAIKFSNPSASININLERTKEGAMFSVKDHGVGVPNKFADKLFDPFTSSKRTGTAGEQPFGLGLYISKQIVEAHRGKIWFSSREGQGATFFVFLPDEKSLQLLAAG